MDYIKLRHDLIRHTNKPEGKKIIQSIMNLCKDLGLKVICMGVENKEQAEYTKPSDAASIRFLLLLSGQPGCI